MHRVTQERTTTCTLALVWETLFGDWPDCQLPLCDYFTAVATNMHPQRVFSLVENCLLVDVSHWFPSVADPGEGLRGPGPPPYF